MREKQEKIKAEEQGEERKRGEVLEASKTKRKMGGRRNEEK